MKDVQEMTAAEIDAVSGGSFWSWVSSFFVTNTGPLDCSKVRCEALVVKG